MRQANFVQVENEYKIIPLTKNETLEGNKLFLQFCGLDYQKSDEWIINCAGYDRSWEELMKIPEKIVSIWDENSGDYNSLRFRFKHMVFHEFMGRKEVLYRKCVEIVKKYFELLQHE
ncbi:MAG: hypothetical protein KBD12_01345 [Candidatus Pacebacteria bacterium]|nr:hypothetical protein [Candidatus Paceibacterota bacterium]